MGVPPGGLLMSYFSQDWLLFITEVDLADRVLAVAACSCVRSEAYNREASKFPLSV